MFQLQIPKRTMFFMGPQCCGKTNALMEMVKLAHSAEQRILLVGVHNQIVDFHQMLSDGPLLPIDYLPVRADEATSKYLKLSSYDLVVYVGSTVFVEPGVVKLYDAPSEGIVKFFQRLCEPTAMLPRVYFETHFEGTETDIAVG